jgi:hypothetical protein
VQHAGRFIAIVEPGPQLVAYDSSGQVTERFDWRPRNDRAAGDPIVPYFLAIGGVYVLDGDQVASHRLDARLNSGIMQLPARYSTLLPSRPGGVFFGVTSPPSGSRTVAVDVILGMPGYSSAGAVNPRILEDSAPPAVCGTCSPYVVASGMEYYKSYSWLARADRYDIQIHRGWGHSTWQIISVRNSPWFSATPGGTAARITGLAHSDDEVLWVSGTIGDSANVTTVIDAIGYDAPDGGGTRVMRSARVLASARFPGRLRFSTYGYAFANRRDASGDYVIDVYRLRMIRG